MYWDFGGKGMGDVAGVQGVEGVHDVWGVQIKC